MSADDLIRILNVIGEQSPFGFPVWRVDHSYVDVEQNGSKFRIRSHWPTISKTSWLIPESALKRLSRICPHIAIKLANPAIDFKDQ